MLLSIFKDLVKYFRFLPHALTPGVLVCFICLIVNRIRLNTSKRQVNVLAWTCMGCYLAVIFVATLWSRNYGTYHVVDLELFKAWHVNQRNRKLIIENAVLFVPYGFVCAWCGIPFVKDTIKYATWSKGLYAILLGTFTSALVEVIQYVSGRGIFQLDDIFMNTLGAAIGFIVYIPVRLIYKTIKNAQKA